MKARPFGTGATQRADMKWGFYAGAHALFSALIDGVSNGKGELTRASPNLIRDVESELGDFFREALKTRSN